MFLCRRIVSKVKEIIFIAMLLAMVTTMASLLHNSVVEYLQPTLLPYPLDINMRAVVANASNNKHVAVEPINPHPFVYSILPQNMCDETEKLFLLVLVKSAAGNLLHRKAIRASWGNGRYYRESKHDFKTVFMLGQPPDGDTGLDERIQREASIYNDIVQENFMDSYLNNTYKTIMAFNWAISYCCQAKFVLFVDDDYFVNMENIMIFLSGQGRKLYSGFRYTGQRPSRTITRKWYVSFNEYPSYIYPDYLAGGAFVMSMNLVKTFHYVFPFVKYFSIDDVYLGIVARKLGVQPMHEPRFRKGNTPAARWSLMSRVFTNHFKSDYQNIFSLWIDQKIPYIRNRVRRYKNT